MGHRHPTATIRSGQAGRLSLRAAAPQQERRAEYNCLMTGQENERGAPDYLGTTCPEEVAKGERPALFTGAGFFCFPSGQREYGSQIVLLLRKECAMAEATCREEYTYQVGKITFIVTPVYKDEGEPMRDILLKLMLADLEPA